MVLEDTVAAIATARGEASIGVVRVSGPQAKSIAMSVVRKPSGDAWTGWPDERTLLYGSVIHPRDGSVLDEAIVLWMPGPRSFTGEDVVELQVHGGVRVLETVLEAVLVAGARLADPGEFTKRAFLNGRLDLSQAEAVMDLIRSKTNLAAAAAVRHIRGGLRDKVRALRKRLVRLEAYVEVSIDYPEHDIEDEARMEVRTVCQDLSDEVEALIQSAHVGQILREGISTVILGRPNVGKSSLMNALLGRDRAIVTDIPGTTRDVLEEYVSLRGVPFRIVDTAGIRDTEDVVERIGVERSRASIDEAEIVVLMIDGNDPLTAEDEQLFTITEGKARVIIINKADLPVRADLDWIRTLAAGTPVVHVSLHQAEDVRRIEQALLDEALGDTAQTLEATFATNSRQTVFLRDAFTDLNAAIEASEAGATLDIIAVQLQSAYAALGQVIGEEVGEDLLDEIFSQFCLGK